MGSHFLVEDQKTALLSGTTLKPTLSKSQQRPLPCLLLPIFLYLFLPLSLPSFSFYLLLKIYSEIKRLRTDKTIERNKVAGFIS